MNTFPIPKTLCAAVSLAMLAPQVAWSAEVASSAAHAAVAVQSPHVRSVALPQATAFKGTPDGGLSVQFNANVPNKPAFFRLQKPSLLVVDVAGATCGHVSYAADAKASTPIEGVRCVQGGGRLRLMLKVPQDRSYNVFANGPVLSVVPVTNANVAGQPNAAYAKKAPSKKTQVFAADHATSVQALQSVNFHRGADGVGVIDVLLPSANVGVNLTRDAAANAVIVDFPKTTMPALLARRLNVQDFGTPVQNVTTFSTETGVRMVISNVGEFHESAYQYGDHFVMQIEPEASKTDASKVAKKKYSGQRLSLDFQDIDLRSLLEVFADFTHMNVVVSDSVSGHITLRLKNVPWDQALAIVLRSKDLGKEVQGNVMWIAPQAEIDKMQRERYEAAHTKNTMEPLKSKVFQLNYQKAADVVTMLTGAAGGATASSATPANSPVIFSSSGQAGAAATTRVLSPRGAVFADPRTNQLFVTDIPDKLAQVKSFLQAIDKPVQQVLIEARIVEANTGFGRELGAKLGFVDAAGTQGGVPGVSIGGSNATLGGDYLGVASATNQPGATGATTADSQMVNLPASTLANTLMTGVNPGSLAISLFSAGANRFINLELSALQSDGKGKIISEPRVITADQQTAEIEQGTEIPYQQSTSSGATSVSFKKAVLSLKVTPQIAPDGTVLMHVEIHKDSVGQNTASGPAINTNTLTTQVQIQNGGTVVLGGIYTEQDNDQTDKVPFFGDIPVVGHLFKTNSKLKQTDELMVFLTPKIIPQKPFSATHLQGGNAWSGSSDAATVQAPSAVPDAMASPGMSAVAAN